MEQKIKVLIADENENMHNALHEHLLSLGAQIVCEAKTEEELLAGIKNFAPDIVLTDIRLGKSEAAGMLKKAKSLFESAGLLPDFIVFSACVSNELFDEIIDSGAAYCMAKPLEYDILKERILRLYRKRKESTHKSPAFPRAEKQKLESAVTGTLHKLGVNANIKGYLYLRTAIMLYAEKTSEMSAVTKALYPAVAKIYGTTPSCVERAMRHAIKSAWERGDLDTLSLYFGNTVKNGRGKPTNSEFIAMIADRIKMQFYP